MTLDRIPAEDHLDLLISFAQISPAIAAYEEIAKSKGLRIVEEMHNGRLFKGKKFGLMLGDENDDDERYSGIARLHCVSLFWEEEDKADEDLGVALVSSIKDLRQAYKRLYQQLSNKLGMPAQKDTWISESMLENEEEEFPEEEFAYACWQLPNSLLVLLLNNEGDMHIGELATVNLRIAPLDRQKGLPNNISDPWSWPVEY